MSGGNRPPFSSARAACSNRSFENPPRPNARPDVPSRIGCEPAAARELVPVGVFDVPNPSQLCCRHPPPQPLDLDGEVLKQLAILAISAGGREHRVPRSVGSLVIEVGIGQQPLELSAGEQSLAYRTTESLAGQLPLQEHGNHFRLAALPENAHARDNEASAAVRRRSLLSDEPERDN